MSIVIYHNNISFINMYYVLLYNIQMKHQNARTLLGVKCSKLIAELGCRTCTHATAAWLESMQLSVAPLVGHHFSIWQCVKTLYPW